MPDTLGLSPLHWAAFHGSPEHCREMLRQHADPLATDQEGKTSLHWLASSKKCENPVLTAKVLVDAEIEANQKSSNNDAPHPYVGYGWCS